MKYYKLLNEVTNQIKLPTPIIGYQGRTTKGLKTLIKDGEGWFASHRAVAIQFADINKYNDLVNNDETEWDISNDELKGEVYKVELTIKNPLFVSIKETLWNRNKERKFITQAKKQGKDALIITNKDKVQSYVVFNNKQIKIL